ncbi:PREDICTED: membrane-spanning 4-domains subfamily A member 6A [Ceratotherium simum simum]|uniref:Membrane-spanning 4-domains subfamily A member 6A n=1 Tax=Ceratotherium simum simum TaxID=73337 RepID=A0ABM1D968_CERSS|nr:PREDICTED: membrane-spanning 4-domains subfamily A member 6A [Ceratotherium simum simum]
MISQPMTNETFVVLTPNGITFLQTESPKPAYQSQGSLKKQLKVEVKVLGTIQILCGMMVLSLGIILASASFSPQFTPVFSTLLKAAYPFIGALCFVSSGCLSIITERKCTKPLVQSSLAANILSSLFALVGFILLSVKLAALDPALRKCSLDKQHTPTEYYYDPYENDCPKAKAILVGTMSVMLICTLLEFCLAVRAALVWWEQSCSDFPGVSVWPDSLSFAWCVSISGLC